MRDEVHIPTVPAAIMLDATTGYIKLHDFGENTDQELGSALARADAEGHEAAGVRPARQPWRRARSGDSRSPTASCRKGDMVVYTRGRVAEFRSGLSRAPNRATI